MCVHRNSSTVKFRATVNLPRVYPCNEVSATAECQFHVPLPITC